MLTLTHEAPAINPTPAEIAVGDRLGWHNDSDANDWFDEYPGPGWQDADDAPYVPTPTEEPIV